MLFVRVAICLVVARGTGAADTAAKIDFNRGIQPILSDHCFPCHGPDAAKRQADLRLDRRDTAFEDRGGYAPFVAGDPDASEAIRRVLSHDPSEQMPPPDAKLELNDEAKRLLVEWVRSGAEWKSHWAFERPSEDIQPPQVPHDQGECLNEIDYFVRAQLAKHNLRPAPPADRATLLRRVYLDLTGLPPTPEEANEFLADESSDAYERVVKRLLNSDEHAEWLAVEWMDVARYADSHGLHADGARTSWPWRDWVISAFHRNMPYGQFVTWQLAGDLLPQATREQRLATAFLRNHPMTGEGGAIDEEFRWHYAFDRMETTATAMLGVTMQCARCHDHKFDPFTQREYYQLVAFFNNVRELGMTGDDGDYGPLLALPDEPTTARLKALRHAIADADSRLDEIRRAEFAEYNSGESVTGATVELLESRHLPLNSMEPVSSTGSSTTKGSSSDDAQRLDGATFVTARRPAEFVPGVAGQAARIEGEYGFLELRDTGLIDVADPLSGALWIRPEPHAEGLPPTSRVLLGLAGDKNTLWRGWEFFLDQQRRLALTLTHGMPSERIHVRTRRPVPLREWTYVAFAYDGSAAAEGVALYIDGRRQTVEIIDDALTKSIYPVSNAVGFPKDAGRLLRVGRSYRSFTGDNGIFNGAIDDLHVCVEQLSDLEIATLYDSYGHGDAAAVEAISPRQRMEHQLLRHSQDWAGAVADRRTLLLMRAEMATATPHVMVMREMPQPRETHILVRGQYDQPAERVSPGTPFTLGALPGDFAANRAGFARWVFSSENPLTARVAVNRYWQLLFGRGLVGTPHDFGVQGERPSHPELLDWLAVSFRNSGWDLRWLLRKIVTSATYRQSSSVAEWRAQSADSASDPLAIDPQNRLLWRAPAHRLNAEAIRDSALAASGLLVKKIGGPSVRPYQPEGLWIEKSNFSQVLLRYRPDTGEGLYRRSLYTFIRRTSPPPSMSTFDAPNRSTCTVRREVTNTPLQALVLLNDPQFVEAARVTAERVLVAGDSSVEQRIARVFRRLASRNIRPSEAEALLKLHDQALAMFANDPESAEKLLQVGEHERLPAGKYDPIDVAALSVVASTVMNYDVFYMRR